MGFRKDFAFLVRRFAILIFTSTMEQIHKKEISRHMLGFPEMDAQHAYLYDIFALLGEVELCNPNDKISLVLKEIERYILFHFSSEELLMRTYGYTSFEVHRGDHENFEEKLVWFNEQYENGALNPRYMRDYLTHWLSEHGSMADSLYVSWIEKKRRELT